MGFCIPVMKGDTHTVNVTVTAPPVPPSTTPVPVDLTGAVVVLSVRTSPGGEKVLLRFVGTITDATAGKVSFLMLPYQTAAIDAGIYNFDIQATLPGGIPGTPIEGFFKVTQDITQELPPLSDIALSHVHMRFVGADGIPQRQRIIVSPVMGLTQVGEYTVPQGRTLFFDADNTGTIDFSLVQGLRVIVAIEGSSLVREFVVPSTPTFDLLQTMAAAPDMFTVQVPAPFLIRRSL